MRYVLEAPFEIGPRLMPAVRLSDGSRVSMEVASIVGGSPERVYWRYVVDAADGTELVNAADIGLVLEHRLDHREAFETLGSFLEAARERLSYERDNGPTGESSLFPAAMDEWIDHNSEEFYSLVMRPEDDDDVDAVYALEAAHAEQEDES